MRHRGARWVGILVAITLLSATGCSTEDTGLGPGTLIEVSNVVDRFRWQLTATVGVTEALTYSWTTTGPVADVTQGGGVLTGTGTIVIRDAGETEVYSRSLDEAGTFPTASGAAGQWTVFVTLDNLTAVTSFSIETP